MLKKKVHKTILLLMVFALSSTQSYFQNRFLQNKSEGLSTSDQWTTINLQNWKTYEGDWYRIDNWFLDRTFLERSLVGLVLIIIIALIFLLLCKKGKKKKI